MNKKDREEDLGIKVVSKEEARWTNVKNRATQALEDLEFEKELNQELLKLAEKKLQK